MFKRPFWIVLLLTIPVVVYSQMIQSLSTVVFDKTGTLTKGEQGLVAMTTAGLPKDTALALAAAIEGDSEHIIARALVAAAQERGLRLPQVSAFEALSGRGVQANVEGRQFQVGGPRLLEQAGVTFPAASARSSSRSMHRPSAVWICALKSEPSRQATQHAHEQPEVLPSLAPVMLSV